MVDIFPHIIQVVVFASCTDTLLGVCSTSQLGHWVGWINGVEEDGLELREDVPKTKDMVKTLEIIECI